MIDKQALNAIISASIYEDDKRLLLNHAFFQGEFLNASDGHVLLRISKNSLPKDSLEDYCSQDKPDMTRVIIPAHDFNRNGIITIDMVKDIIERLPSEITYGYKEIECPECHGEGLIEATYTADFDDEEYTFEEQCPICDGEGKVEVEDKNQPIQIPEDKYPIKIYSLFVPSVSIKWLRIVMDALHIRKVIVRYINEINHKIVLDAGNGIELYLMGLIIPEKGEPGYKTPIILIQ